jgi:predicted transcriptional regulator
LHSWPPWQRARIQRAKGERAEDLERSAKLIRATGLRIEAFDAELAAAEDEACWMIRDGVWLGAKMAQNPVGMANRSVLGWGNRGWVEIVDLMLTVCEGGALKTHVMYECNLNSKQLQQYLDFMLNRKLVSTLEVEGEVKRTKYVTTDRGRKLMAAYDELADIFGIEDHKIDT